MTNLTPEQTASLRKTFDAHAASIIEMTAPLRETEDYEDAQQEATDEIFADALSVEVRSGWHQPGEDQGEAAEFAILIATGGPAARIIGTLDGGTIEAVRLEVQDWGTPWWAFPASDELSDALLTYAAQFYFGD